MLSVPDGLLLNISLRLKTVGITIQHQGRYSLTRLGIKKWWKILYWKKTKQTKTKRKHFRVFRYFFILCVSNNSKWNPLCLNKLLLTNTKTNTKIQGEQPMCAHRAVYCLKHILHCRTCQDFNQSDNHMDNMYTSALVFSLSLQIMHLESLPSTEQLKQYYFPTSMRRVVREKTCRERARSYTKKVIQQSNQQADPQLRESRQGEKSWELLEWTTAPEYRKEWKVNG